MWIYEAESCAIQESLVHAGNSSLNFCLAFEFVESVSHGEKYPGNLTWGWGFVPDRDGNSSNNYAVGKKWEDPQCVFSGHGSQETTCNKAQPSSVAVGVLDQEKKQMQNESQIQE